MRQQEEGGGCVLFKDPPESFLDDDQLGSYVLGDSWWFSRVNKDTFSLRMIFFFNNLRGNFFYIKSSQDI